MNQSELTETFMVILNCTHVGQTGPGNLLRMMRWHCPLDTEFEIRDLAVWGRVRYLSVTEAPHNIESLRVSGEKNILFLWNLKPERDSNPR